MLLLIDGVDGLSLHVVWRVRFASPGLYLVDPLRPCCVSDDMVTVAPIGASDGSVVGMQGNADSGIIYFDERERLAVRQRPSVGFLASAGTGAADLSAGELRRGCWCGGSIYAILLAYAFLLPLDGYFGLQYWGYREAPKETPNMRYKIIGLSY